MLRACPRVPRHTSEHDRLQSACLCLQASVCAEVGEHTMAHGAAGRAHPISCTSTIRLSDRSRLSRPGNCASGAHRMPHGAHGDNQAVATHHVDALEGGDVARDERHVAHAACHFGRNRAQAAQTPPCMCVRSHRLPSALWRIPSMHQRCTFQSKRVAAARRKPVDEVPAVIR
jgi:hypothetical protein